jgi:hypothetical protein
MKRMFAGAAMTVALLAAFSGPAGAAVTGTTGQVVSVSAPPSVADGTYTSNTEIRVFAEKEVTLTASLTVAEVWTPTGKVSKTWGINTCFQSHLIHYDRANGAADGRLSGTVTFAKPVVAVLPFVVGLVATDALVGLPTTTYPAVDALRGFEPASVLVTAAEADSLTASTATSLTLDLFERSTVLVTDSKMDEIRVLTECDSPTPVVPEAGRTVLLSLGAVGAIGAAVVYNRRRQLRLS